MKQPCSENQDRLPRSDLYIVYSMSNSAYQQWQADLLDFSVHATGQPGVIVRLCSLEGGAQESRMKPSERGYTFVTPSFAELGRPSVQRLVGWSKRLLKHRVHGRFHFYCLNKALAMKSFLESHPDLDDEAKLLWLDPDMVFCKPWSPPASMVRRGVLTGQHWWGYDPSWCRRTAGCSDEADLCPPGDSAIMFPFCITVGDMRAIVDAYARFSAEIYHRARDWKSEMYGLVMAMGAARLECHTIAALGTCNNWPGGLPDNSDAPISHYTQVMHDRDGRELWDKRKYTPHTMATPWHRPPDPGRASSLTDQRALQMLHRFIDWQDEQSQPAPAGKAQK